MLWVLIWTIGITVLRGQSYPDDYGEGQWLLNYQLGFIRRGFAGTLLQLSCDIFAVKPSASIIFGCSLFIELVLLSVLFLAMRQMLKQTRSFPETALLCLVFASSPLIVTLANNMGFFDGLLVVCLALSLLSLWRGWYGLAAVIQVAAVLTHEIYFLIELPTFIIAWWLCKSTPERSLPAKSWLSWGLPVGAFVILVGYQTIARQPEHSHQLILQHLNQPSIISINRSQYIAETFTASLSSQLNLNAPFFGRRLTNPTLLRLILPNLLLTALYCYRINRYWPLFVVSLLPLTMHLFAWDTFRIWMFPLVPAFGLTFVLSQANKKFTRLHFSRLPIWLWAGTGVLALYVNSSPFVPLMHNATDLLRFHPGRWKILYLPTLLMGTYWIIRGTYAHHRLLHSNTKV